MHTQTDIVVLEARSQAQALDWSLVLISQGIESVIMPRADNGAWTLEISGTDARRAHSSIAAYERENATVWRQELKWTGLLFDVRAVAWFAALAVFYFLAAAAPTDFTAAGCLDRAAVARGEWWRLGTAVTLHADGAHLMANVTTGVIFLGLAMACYGPGVAVLLSFLGGIIGNAATFALHADGPFRSLGASGMVMASLGLLTAHSLAGARHERRAVRMGRGVIAGCLLVVLLGFSPRSDVGAHLGGFAAGTALGMMAMRHRAVLLRPGGNAGSLLVCAALVIGSWWLALR